MNLNLYQIFHTVAAHSNISSASKVLYISQPAISKAILKLEQSLNTTLFIRSSKGVRLTPEGQILYDQLSDAFRAISFGEEQLRKMKELGVGQISIGVSTTLCKYILLPYLKAFIHDNPHIKISIACQSTNHTLEALQNGSIDLGLIGEPDSYSNLTFHPIAEINDIFVTTPSYIDNFRTRIPSASFEDMIENATFLMLDKENLTRQHIDAFLNSQSLTIKQMLEVSTMDLLIDFAKIDLGIACVIKNFIEKELTDNSLVTFPFPTPIPPRKVGFAYNNCANPALRKFLSYPCIYTE